MCSRSYECIISKVATDIRLNDLTTDPISINEVFILTLRAPFLIWMTSRHGIQRRSHQLAEDINKNNNRNNIKSTGSQWPQELPGRARAAETNPGSEVRYCDRVS